MNAASIEEKKKELVWQCRRGLKEIEVLLVPFLEKHYQHESPEIRRLFEALLEEEDLDIFEWFTRRVKPDTEQMEEIINVILLRLEN